METLQAMLLQEAKHYTKEDFHLSQIHAMKDVQSQYPTQKLDPIDSSCRTKMCAWFQQICNFCQYDEDEMLVIIENAINYMDRYVVTPKGSVALLDRNYYQGMAITCLYMATKIHASAAISAADMSQITRFVYTTEQIEEMEYHILDALQFHVNPPTVSVFVSEYMKILIAQLHQSQMVSASDDASIVSLLQTVKDLIHTQTLETFSDEKFITVPASIIAYTAIVNAVQLLVPVHEFNDSFNAIQVLILANVPDQSKTNVTIMSVLHHLQQLLQPSVTLPSSPTIFKAKDSCQPQRFMSSPITATAIVTPQR